MSERSNIVKEKQMGEEELKGNVDQTSLKKSLTKIHECNDPM